MNDKRLDKQKLLPLITPMFLANIAYCIGHPEKVPAEKRERMVSDLLGISEVIAAAPEQPSPAALSLEPVAVVVTDYSLHWAGTGPIAPICERTGVKVGSKLVSVDQAQAYIEREREAITNAALAKAAKVPRAYAEQLDRAGWGKRFPDELAAIFNATPNMEHQILRMKSQPAQPCVIKCGKCGQSDNGQTGEYPCIECGLPTLHDEPAQLSGNSGELPSDSQSEVSDIEKDAARYRWLRDQDSDIDCLFNVVNGSRATANLESFKSGPELDIAVDAAMRAREQS